jgi:hypothetical protein
MARYASASSSTRWRSSRYGPMRRTSAVSMKSSSSTAADAAEVATAAHRSPRIGRTSSAIPAFTAGRYALEYCERRARSGFSIFYS